MPRPRAAFAASRTDRHAAREIGIDYVMGISRLPPPAPHAGAAAQASRSIIIAWPMPPATHIDSIP